MRPTRETEKKRIQGMLAMQTLANNVDFKDLNPLLVGIVVAIFRNPLLRLVIVDEKSYIAHVVPCGKNGIMFRFDDNPLENSSSEGDLRISVMDDSGVLLVEKNMGKVPETPTSRSIDRRMGQLGSSMRCSGNYLGRASEEYSHLLHMTIGSHGSAFVWKRHTEYSLSDFETLKIVEQKQENSYDDPTFDLVLGLSDLAKKKRKATNEP